MCLLCEDEKAYAAYMDYLDALEKQGPITDPDAALDAVLDSLQKRDAERAKSAASPFKCDSVEE